MTSFHLKLIAVLTMFIDHVGRVFFPGDVAWFIIGRLSFPLFAYLVATGALYTKNSKKYLNRLFIFALISQIPFSLVSWLTDPTSQYLNVLFTLFFGLLAIELWKIPKPTYLKVAAVSFLAILVEFCSTDYGGLGVLSVFFFYIFHKDQHKMFLSQVAIFSLINIHQLAQDIIKYQNIVDILYYIPFAIFSLLFIAFYSGKEGRKLQYAFYAIYPLHFIIIYLIKTML